jgi:hypothetical protein
MDEDVERFVIVLRTTLDQDRCVFLSEAGLFESACRRFVKTDPQESSES